MGRTGYQSDALICPLRSTCKRHLDMPENAASVSIAMHLCHPPLTDAYIPIKETCDA
jgi:hypothetical protein